MNDASTLVRTPGTALHRQIFLVLRDRIVQGIYPPGTALPKEEALVEHFGVARVTVRRALADLEGEGLVLRRHGRGTFVRDNASSSATAVPTLSFVDELRHTAQTTQVTVLAVEKVPPPPSVGAVLQTLAGEPAVHVLRLRSTGDIPLMLNDAWLPAALGRGITATALKRRALYELLLDNGVEFGRVVQQISADAADPMKAQLLRCGVSTPLIRLTRLVHDRKGRPVQHMTVHLTPQRSRILMDIPGDAIDTFSGGHIVHNPELVRASSTESAAAGKRRRR